MILIFFLLAFEQVLIASAYLQNNKKGKSKRALKSVGLTDIVSLFHFILFQDYAYFTVESILAVTII